jgi:hypothetical protein
MISDVDAALAELLRSEAVAGGAEVVFDAPTKEWASRRNSPTIDVFLYDIREDVGRRDAQPEVVRNEDGRVIDRRPPPRRFKLSYLITAWTRRPEDEHRLLAQLLSTLLRHDRIPRQYLNGSLKELPLPVLLHLALPAGQDRSLTDIWSALGGELKPSLDLVAVAPIDPARSYAVGPPVLEEAHLRVRRTNRIDAEDHAGVPAPHADGSTAPGERAPARAASPARGSGKARSRKGSAPAEPPPQRVRSIEEI